MGRGGRAEEQGKQSWATSSAKATWGTAPVSPRAAPAHPWHPLSASMNLPCQEHLSSSPARSLECSSLSPIQHKLSPPFPEVSFSAIRHSCLSLPRTSTCRAGWERARASQHLAELMETRHQRVLHPQEGLRPVGTSSCESKGAKPPIVRDGGGTGWEESSTAQMNHEERKSEAGIEFPSGL